MTALNKRLATFGLACVALCWGCGAPVREDRQIEWSADGKSVAFEHDQKGVFVASASDGKATRIFQPDASTVAVSRPLRSPTDSRLIFATAQPPDGAAARVSVSNPALAPPPEGRVVFMLPVTWTCWLQPAAVAEELPPPERLFSAGCDHVGYVAGGLIVRWRPDGQAVIYLAADEHEPHRQTLYEFDLLTKSTRRVFPHAADAMVFDFTPRGTYLTCVVGNLNSTDPNSGIWIGKINDERSWWKVANSELLATGELPSLIEALRASRPAWTQDEARFANVSCRQPAAAGEIPRHELKVTQFIDRIPQVVAQSNEPFADLFWSPDGQSLGFIERTAGGWGNLRLRRAAGELTGAVNTRPVRRFAGFSPDGTQVAYVAPDPSPALPAAVWSLLLPPDPAARDAVIVADATGETPGVVVFTDMRVTFPAWSPTGQKLSLWLTFVPRYRSMLSIFFGWGLRPGDPAALVDLPQGTVTWLPVSPGEELQVGHYYALKGDYATAWEWYERANQKLSATAPPPNFEQALARLQSPEQAVLFQSICLAKLGRNGDAAQKRREFEQNLWPVARAAGDAATGLFGLFLHGSRQGALLRSLVASLYEAEVYLALGLGADAITQLEHQMPLAESDAARLGQAVVLSQLLLIERRHTDYVALATDTLAPLALREWQALGQPAADGSADGGTPRFWVESAMSLSLAPLFHADFVKELPHDVLADSVTKWLALRGGLAADGLSTAMTLCLRAAQRELHDTEGFNAANARLAANPGFLLRGQTPDESIDELFRQFLNRPQAGF